MAATSALTSVATDTMTLRNAGTGALTGITSTVRYDTLPPVQWLAVGLSGRTAPTVITVFAAARGLQLGATYRARVEFTAPEASNNPRVLTVVFALGPPPPR